MDKNTQEETTVEERIYASIVGKCAYRHHLEDGLMDAINIELKKAYDEGFKKGRVNEKVHERA